MQDVVRKVTSQKCELTPSLAKPGVCSWLRPPLVTCPRDWQPSRPVGALNAEIATTWVVSTPNERLSTFVDQMFALDSSM